MYDYKKKIMYGVLYMKQLNIAFPNIKTSYKKSVYHAWIIRNIYVHRSLACRRFIIEPLNTISVCLIKRNVYNQNVLEKYA